MGARGKAEGRKKEETRNLADLERKVRGIFTSRVYRYFNRHRGYILRKRGGWGVDPVYFRRPEDRESFVPRRHTPRRDISSHDTDESCTAALRNPYTL